MYILYGLGFLPALPVGRVWTRFLFVIAESLFLRVPSAPPSSLFVGHVSCVTTESRGANLVRLEVSPLIYYSLFTWFSCIWLAILWFPGSLEPGLSFLPPHLNSGWRCHIPSLRLKTSGPCKTKILCTRVLNLVHTAFQSIQHRSTRYLLCFCADASYPPCLVSELSTTRTSQDATCFLRVRYY